MLQVQTRCKSNHLNYLSEITSSYSWTLKVPWKVQSIAFNDLLPSLPKCGLPTQHRYATTIFFFACDRLNAPVHTHTHILAIYIYIPARASTH